MKKRNLVVTTVVAAGVIGFAFFAPLDTWVRSPFIVKPVTEQELKATIEGYVSVFPVKEGQMVKEGELIAVLHSDVEERRYEEIRDNIDRVLRRKQIATAMDKVAEAKALQIEIDSLEKQLAKQAEHLRKQKVTAPFDGVVLRADPAEWLDPMRVIGRRYKPGEVICSIAKMDKVMMKAFVEEWDQGKIGEKAKVVAKVGAFPDKEFEATVDKVGKAGGRVLKEAEILKLVPAAQTQEGLVSAVVHYEAILRFQGEEDVSDLKPGLTGEAKIYAGKRTIAARIGSWAWTKLRTMFRF